ncbi:MULTISPECIES: ABC transporter ATP-binding protein [Alcaligenaceae]|jgi:branched-chain amino acid transport system ATP-binding protein|uniref:ABC transporter ATP-binding protein n=1 Tax=Neopusillimonas maritima TaxID=2026239 RepID=A0ABX9MU47_9BURK|nr:MULTISPECIES: ABC transporter ATP-binding protein [Alcaligenaceae]QIM49614.1 ABC transporter ATP-binding protein [Pusillimonas sp. DMV24BSW_D]RII82101.1 ABC transporter ATP-binding protein [Neopusillimonas maritima]ROT45331.1 ABC transporter ATP-binding protein [Pusillimonas sp. NJUB218]
MSQTLLSAKNITRRFGGLIAINNASLNLNQGAVHAVIGTNGAGKSTLVSVLSGEIPPNEGQIKMLDKDITDWSQPDRAQAGLGRSYQRTTIFPSLSVHENCRISAQSKHQKFWNWGTPHTKCDFTNEAASHALELAGLSQFAHRKAGLLSHGGKRQLEIAMCLATRPKVLLLDEPLAGMGAEETDRMLGLLNDLKKEHAVLLVEHDMDAVFRISDEITVMVNGCVIAHGEPEEIRNNPDVQTAYLGDEA